MSYNQSVTTNRIAYERGLELIGMGDGSWALQNRVAMEPKEVYSKFKVRPVLLNMQIAQDTDAEFLVPFTKGRYLDIEVSELYKMAINKDINTMVKSFNLSYILGSVIYHCKRLANTYCEITTTFARIPTSGEDESIFNGREEPYYEFDALITSAKRALDSMRYILWSHFGFAKSTTPSSFKKTLETAENIPPTLIERLQYSWSRYGTKMKDFRDCIQHYIPLYKGMPAAHMKLLDGGAWSTSIWLPDNPEVRSQAKFQYKSRIDALTYGWELTTEILEIAQLIVQEVPNRENPK